MPAAGSAEFLRAERGLVAALGGYSVELAGGILTVHERIPVPRFNYVASLRATVERSAAFFETALDHYFQRALRPAFRFAAPADDHLAATASRYAFRRVGELGLFTATPGGAQGSVAGTGPTHEIVPAADGDPLDRLVDFLVPQRERLELRRSVQVAALHPHRDERLEPAITVRAGRPVGAGLLYVRDGTAVVPALATAPAERRRGAASELVRYFARRANAAGADRLGLFADDPAARARLGALGFTESARWEVFGLPADARLELPPPGPPTPPRWRPRRSEAPGAPD